MPKQIKLFFKPIFNQIFPGNGTKNFMRFSLQIDKPKYPVFYKDTDHLSSIRDIRYHVIGGRLSIAN